ncbi:MAG: penicillin acylase family protein, partial [Acidobacteriota bacterium]
MNSASCGVNEGLASLDDKPFELIVLGVDPAPWTPVDSVLVAYCMYEDLQDPTDAYESTLGLMNELMPPQLAEFISPLGTSWDAPVIGEALGTPPVPSAEVVDLRDDDQGRDGETRLARREIRPLEKPLPWRNLTGSNNWAVSGARTASGSALVANDMHLPLNVPNFWYRASMLRPDGDGGEVALHGATLPGLPALIVGSNTHIAWGYTVSHHDSKDLVLIEEVDGKPDHYKTPDGPRPFERVVEQIKLKGSGVVEREVVHTIWGPILKEDHLGRRYALRWVGHEPDAVNFLIHELETAETVQEALDIARRMSAPNQNFVVGDATGSVGWTVLGRIPRRVGFEGRRPTSWADGTRSWDGWLSPEEVPAVLDPPSGLVWSANSRVADIGTVRLIGDGGYDLGARARQIRDGLMALDVATPQDMLDIQLDDRALFLERWRSLLLEVLTPEVIGDSADRAEFRRLVEEDWDGRASTDSVGFRLVRTYRLLLSELIFAGVAEPLYEADDDFRFFMRVPQMEGPLWALVDGRPPHLLPPGYADWTEVLAEGVDRTTTYLGDNFANATWGKRNSVQPHHLFSRFLPVLRPWLDPAEVELPGDV